MSSDLQLLPSPLNLFERISTCAGAMLWFAAGAMWILIASRLGRHSGYSVRPILMLHIVWVWSKSAVAFLVGFGFTGAERFETYLQPLGGFSVLILGVWVLAFHREKWRAMGTVIREPSYLDLVVAMFTEPFRSDPQKPGWGRRRDDMM